MIKIYPSSAAFAKGPQSNGAYNNSCYRYQVVADHADQPIKSNINPIYAAVGALDEHRYEQVLISRGYDVQAEVAKRDEIAPGVIVSGRRDFVISKSPTEQSDWSVAIVEKKSTISKSKKTRIKKRQIEESQLAQLVTYMALDKINTGFLVQTFYYFPKDLNRLEVGAEVEYKITLKDRSIYVDNELYERTLDDLAAYYKTQIFYRQGKQIGPRPANAHKPYGSPCNFCPLKDFCNEFDLGHISEHEMLTDVPKKLIEITETQEPRPAQIWASKRY